MKNFEYLQPKSLQEASTWAGSNRKEALLYAGGTDLLGLMKDVIITPKKVINLKSIKGLNKIIYTPGKGLQIGALTTISSIAEHPLINEKYPVLAQAAHAVASPQLRNMGTIGGNICQRPRCWYFRGDFPCLRKGGDVCYAVDGQNKYHCIIGGDSCYIVHPSDAAVALLALDAKLSIFSGEKSHSVSLSDFFVLPEQDLQRENILKPGEIVTEIQVPDLPKNSKSGYLKFKERGAWDFAVVSVATVIQRNGAAIKSGRIVLGGVAPIPWFDQQISSRLVGLPLSEKNLTQVANEALPAAEPLNQNEYKLPLARNLIKRLLKKLISI